MTVPAKGLRKITVGQVAYRWKGSGVVDQRPRGVRILLRAEDRKGQLAFVFFPTDVVKDFFLDPYEKVVWDDHDMRRLTPANVEFAILECLRLGWRPKNAGPTLNFEFSQDHSTIVQLDKAN